MINNKQAIICVTFGFCDEVINGPELMHRDCALEWIICDSSNKVYTARFYSNDDFGLVLETWERLPKEDFCSSLWCKTNDRRKLAPFEEKFK